jgi:hypothetical protein
MDLSLLTLILGTSAQEKVNKTKENEIQSHN